MTARIRKDDTVIVIAGKDKGRSGRVLKVLPKEDRVVVEGVNMVKRHTAPNVAHPKGGVIAKEASLHVSNVALRDPKTGKPTRVAINSSAKAPRAAKCASPRALECRSMSDEPKTEKARRMAEKPERQKVATRRPPRRRSRARRSRRLRAAHEAALHEGDPRQAERGVQVHQRDADPASRKDRDQHGRRRSDRRIPRSSPRRSKR